MHTMLERLQEEVSYEAPDPRHKQVVVDAEFVRTRLEKITQDEDLSKFIL